MNNSSATTTTKIGADSHSTGRTKRASGMPLANQIVISDSRYMRPSEATMAMNSDKDSIVGKCASEA